jgi:hypothetical protein
MASFTAGLEKPPRLLPNDVSKRFETAGWHLSPGLEQLPPFPAPALVAY